MPSRIHPRSQARSGHTCGVPGAPMPQGTVTEMEHEAGRRVEMLGSDAEVDLDTVIVMDA